MGEVLKALDAAHPGFGERLFDDTGALRRFVNVFLADEDVRFLDGLDTPVADGQTLSWCRRSPGADRRPAGGRPGRRAVPDVPRRVRPGCGGVARR